MIITVDNLMFLYDEAENTKTRFVSFMGETARFDLAITSSGRFYGKLLVLNLLSNRFAIIGKDDLDEPGYLEHVYQMADEEAEELRQFLYTLS
ncbi:DUF3055 domain-containing protein [Hazenella sp. IB182357]|uniref:DUF3055 domain-containing protein n=1 Tax=Polycladospora coralii TaxID=2771432 RepID=A0A926N8Q8_9BACL|nr:DUF3055 domain-containing protein [Polycladospora coralii]MBD1370870.1 DUF3055 domain-containing protein [Polycladospora coralii]MBS7529809.1 DUF3055 domain-containing protein [Polycladospora coralii]